MISNNLAKIWSRKLLHVHCTHKFDPQLFRQLRGQLCTTWARGYLRDVVIVVIDFRQDAPDGRDQVDKRERDEACVRRPAVLVGVPGCTTVFCLYLFTMTGQLCEQVLVVGRPCAFIYSWCSDKYSPFQKENLSYALINNLNSKHYLASELSANLRKRK